MSNPTDGSQLDDGKINKARYSNSHFLRTEAREGGTARGWSPVSLPQLSSSAPAAIRTACSGVRSRATASRREGKLDWLEEGGSNTNGQAVKCVVVDEYLIMADSKHKRTNVSWKQA